MDLTLLRIPKNFYFDEPFKVDEESLRIFLKNIRGTVSYGGDVNLNKIDVQKTINSHTSNSRLFYKNGDIVRLDAEYLIMKSCCTHFYEDIYGWMEKKTPQFFKDHLEKRDSLNIKK